MKEAPAPIFLVEDNEIYLKTLEQHVKAHVNSGTPVYTFMSGEDCLKNMNKNPKIVVLDYFLNSSFAKAMNGLDVLRKIKSSNPDTTVLMLSSQDNIEVATDTMKYGAFDYIQKGENAFIRIQNAMNNIEKMIHQAIVIRTGRQVKRILVAWIVLLVITIVVLQVFFPGLMNRNF